MRFEYDPEKSLSNREKHGIDFEEAQALWLDPDLIEIRARTEDEPRHLVIGKIGDPLKRTFRRHWSGVITYRGGAIRMISVRRSRREEVELYESF